MNLTNQKILDFANTPLGNKKLPMKLAYAITVNTAAMAPALEGYNAGRMTLLNGYAKTDEKGELVIENGNYIIEDIEGWNTDIKALLETEANVPVTTVPVDVLDKCDDPAFDKLSVRELAVISFMIEG